MNRSDSNPLLRELARSRHGDSHPDSDILTAFSEDALLHSERQKVMAHLAACADCREVLSIAAAAALDSTEDLKPLVVTHPKHQPQRVWLPWASIAATLLVVSSAVLVYQQRQAATKNTAVAKNEAVQLPSSMSQQLLPLPPPKETKTLHSKEKIHEPRQLKAPLVSQNITVANAMPETPIEAAKKSTSRQQDSYQTSAEAGGMSTSRATVQKAAPALSVSAFAGAAPARELATRPHWRINSLGQPERSFGDGAWQAVLPREQSRMRVVSVFDGEVWIGGDSSRLYHSTDNGTTWNPVTLPDKDGRKHSIAHIHFQTAQSGTVESDDGIAWSTLNGGSTWK